MDNQGTLTVQVYTARKAIPLADASVSIMKGEGAESRLLAFLKTDEDGKTEPVILDAPEAELAYEPEGGRPYCCCNIQVDLPGYRSVLVENAQIFSGVESIQEVEMVPVIENPRPGDLSIIYDVTPQDL